MKITFLGTSHGVPAADRYCSCSMIETGGALYFIDAGAPLIDILTRRGEDLRAVKAIFTTHYHADHTDGIAPLANLFTWYYKETDVDIYMTEKTAIDAIRAYMAGQLDHLEEDRVRFRLMTDKTAFDDGRLRVTPFPTRHLAGQGRPAYSFLVEAEGKSILFSGDLSGRLAENDFPRYALDHSVDLMICEMAHFGIDEVSPYLERCRAKTLLFNHVFPLGKLEGIAALDMKWGYPIRAVADGDEIVL